MENEEKGGKEITLEANNNRCQQIAVHSTSLCVSASVYLFLSLYMVREFM